MLACKIKKKISSSTNTSCLFILLHWSLVSKCVWRVSTNVCKKYEKQKHQRKENLQYNTAEKNT